jgi:hypothetical protein
MSERPQFDERFALEQRQQNLWAEYCALGEPPSTPDLERWRKVDGLLGELSDISGRLAEIYQQLARP